MASYLVVANRTLGGENLAAHLRSVIDSDPAASFTVVVPVRLPVATDPGGVMTGIPVLDPSGWADITDASRRRLDQLLAWFAQAGVPATGSLAIDGPMAAIERAMQDKHYDGIIISTMPAGVSRWLRMDLVHRVERRFPVPVTAVVGARPDGPGEMSLPATGAAAPTKTGTATERASSAVPTEEDATVAESVYKIIELVGTSPDSWEKAAAAAVETASRSLRDLRVAEVVELDLVIDDGAVTTYRAKVKVSFKYEDDAD